MPRAPKYPDHREKADQLMNELLDELVSLWTGEKEPQMQNLAEELGMTSAKVRKLLITAEVRDGKKYYSSPAADRVLYLWKEKKSVEEICHMTGLSRSSVIGYIPHSKVIYSLDTMSAEAERIKVFRERKAAVEALQRHLDLPDELYYLWKAVIAFENYPFTTSGRGKEHKGATKFKYTVSRSGGSGGRHYNGDDVLGYGNEIWIEGREKSISRSTVDLAYRNGRAVQASEGFVSGPHRLGIPGCRSQLYALFLRFGVIIGE